MRRGELYLVAHPGASDPRRARAFAVVSRQVLIDSQFSTVICAPVYTTRDGLTTQVPVGVDEGLKHPSSIHCDELVSLPKSRLTRYVGALAPAKLRALAAALRAALELTESHQAVRYD
ncbi:MAG TPA: type II toxin-antitoxin system PemK/MazF family toxin [Polyangia bacterium]